MGIRFYCPNGHKLNVKEFQSGKRGICPFCGSRIEIPTESTRESSKYAKASEAPAHDVTPQGQPETMPSPGGAAVVPAPSSPVPSPPAPTGPAVNQPLAGPSAWPSVAMPQQPAPGGPVPMSSVPMSSVPMSSVPGSFVSGRTSSAGQTPPDPIAEAGDVVWYVRPASGGQFGPAGADVMRSWIEEGRVSADSLVWHEGWRDWQEASEVFVQPGAIANDPGVGPIGTAVGSRASTLRNSRATARRRSNTTQTLVIVGLILAVVILLGVFVLIVSGSSANADDSRRLAPVLTSASTPQWTSVRPSFPSATRPPLPRAHL